MMKLNKARVGIALTTALLAFATGSLAAGEQEIIVTASKRESTIQELPFSVNAQTEADIQRMFELPR